MRPFRQTRPEGVFCMEKSGKLRYALSGAAAGLTNGFFGGGGGSVLVPLLTRVCGLSQRQAFATSVAVILPWCVRRAPIALWGGGRRGAAPPSCRGGGAAGGWLGGKWFRGMKMPWLKRLFGLLLLYGGARCFLP